MSSNRKLLIRSEVDESACFKFLVNVTVSKAVYDQTTVENQQMLDYHARIKRISKLSYVTGIMYGGPEFLPFAEVPLVTKTDFKNKHLTSETETEYIFTFDNWIRVDMLEHKGNEIHVKGPRYKQIITETEMNFSSNYDTKAVFRFDSEDKFLSATFHGFTSSDVYHY